MLQSEKYLFNTYQADEVIRLGVGMSVDCDVLSEMAERRAVIEAATQQIADRLIRGSDGKIDPYRQEDPVFDLITTSGHVEQARDRYQNWNVLPAVASQNRRDMAAALALYLHLCEERDIFEVSDRYGEIHSIPFTKPGRSIKHRYAVLTGGVRCNLHHIENRVKSIRLSLQKAVKKLHENGLPIEIIFQSVEVTLKRDAYNLVWAHPHLNIIYRFERRLNRREWDAFLRIMNKVMNGRNWRDCGVLQDAKEAVKYVTKMTTSSDGKDDSKNYDLSIKNDVKYDYGKDIGLLDLTDEELCEYFYQMGPMDKTGKQKKRKLLLPMGGFKKVCKLFDEWGIRFRSVNIGGKRGNAPIARKKREKRDDAKRTPGNSGPVENLIIAETLPYPDLRLGYTTTKLKVSGFNPNPTTAIGRRRLKQIRQIIEQRCDDARANGQSVDVKKVWQNVKKWRISAGSINLDTLHDTAITDQPPSHAPPPPDEMMLPQTGSFRFLSNTELPAGT